MFTESDRAEVERRVLALARSDPRVVAGAVVGSRALGPGDRWSDLDLTFGVVDETQRGAVLESWTKTLVDECAAVPLFDVWSGAAIYRVFLFPRLLQVDLSFAPAADFGARGPNFRLLFGEAASLPHSEPMPAAETFGHAVHHTLRARICIERGQLLQAEHWISAVRGLALTLACRRRGLSGAHGRGYDELPRAVIDAANTALVQGLERGETERALGASVALLLTEAAEVGDLAERLAPQLRAMAEH